VKVISPDDSSRLGAAPTSAINASISLSGTELDSTGTPWGQVPTVEVIQSLPYVGTPSCNLPGATPASVAYSRVSATQ
jgi:hypothetical protein